MTIRRDDLAAAAALGLLQYRQIDPLLVFLLQRDVIARRKAMLKQSRMSKYDGFNRLLSYMVALLAIVTTALFGTLFTTRAGQSIGAGTLAFLSALYLLAGLGISAWFRKRGYCRRIRVLAAVIMAAAPLAVVALQHVTA